MAAAIEAESLQAAARRRHQSGCRTIPDLARVETFIPNGRHEPVPPPFVESALHV